MVRQEVRDILRMLPATIVGRTEDLSAAEKEILTYLIIRGADITAHGPSHEVSFDCECYFCYIGFRTLCDDSPNTQLMDELIEHYQELHNCSKLVNDTVQIIQKQIAKERAKISSLPADCRDHKLFLAKVIKYKQAFQYCFKNFFTLAEMIRFMEDNHGAPESVVRSSFQWLFSLKPENEGGPMLTEQEKKVIRASHESYFRVSGQFASMRQQGAQGASFSS